MPASDQTNQRSLEYGGELRALAAQAEEDHRRLRANMNKVGVRPNVVSAWRFVLANASAEWPDHYSR